MLKVTLLGLDPPIWRRIALASDITLGELHHVLQEAMGWQHSHLHDFRVGKTIYGDQEMLVETAEQDEWEASLAQVAPKEKKRFLYTYDVGDNWEHEILVEAVQAPEPGTRYPVCLAGEFACPPEDVGGVWGYADLLEALADPNHPDREEMLDWVDESFDPTAFNLTKVNARLKRLR
jgi:hypothetical protein